MSTEALMAGPKAQYRSFEKKAKLSGHADFVMETIGTTNVPGIKQLKIENKGLEEVVLFA